MADYTRSVRIEWKGLNKLKAMLGPAGMKRALSNGLDDAAVFVEGRAKTYAPVKTGRLQHDIHVQGLGMGNSRLIVSGSSEVRYASAVHEGSGLYGPNHQRYAIRPKNKKMLMFPAAGVPVRATGKMTNAARRAGGAFVFTKLVMHPGMKGRPYLKRALDDLNFSKILGKAMVRRWRQAKAGG